MIEILVVDDEPHATRLLELRLEAAGYRVDVATDGLEALERVESKRYDLVLTDVCMPRMTGRELCEEIRKRSLTEPALIVVTSRPEAEYRQWIEQLPDAVLMEKPLSVRRLLQHLGERFGSPADGSGSPAPETD